MAAAVKSELAAGCRLLKFWTNIVFCNENNPERGASEMKYDVAALGELLVDFASVGQSGQGSPLFEANPGGAPCNVLAMLAKLGKKTAFIGKVGGDMFGAMLKAEAEAAGIYTGGLVQDPEFATTLAFVQTAADGERDFAFFRSHSADTMLKETELRTDIIENCKIFHFGSLSLTDSPAKEATRRAVSLAKSAGAVISFDPNLRPALWQSLGHAKNEILWGCGQSNITKLAAEELELVTGTANPNDGADAYLKQFPQTRLLLLTDGKNGSAAYTKSEKASCPAFLNPKTIDTTGAGDTFFACCLSFVLENGLDSNGLTQEKLALMLTFANAAGSLITTKKGAMRAMPRKSDIEEFINNNKR